MATTSILSRFAESGIFSALVKVKRNELLSRGGAINTDIYFIQSGTFRVYILDDGQERNIRFGYAGNIIVSMDSFLSGKPSDFYIQAIKKAEVRVAKKSDFEEFLKDEAGGENWWRMVLEDLVLQQVEREKDLLIQSPKERFERVKARSPRLFQEIPLRHIANYLRMTPETLSRLQKP